MVFHRVQDGLVVVVVVRVLGRSWRPGEGGGEVRGRGKGSLFTSLVGGKLL